LTLLWLALVGQFFGSYFLFTLIAEGCSLSSSVTDLRLSFGSTIVTCLIIIFSPSLCDAGLLLKMKPQHPQRTKNPKMAESPMAAA